MHVTKRVWCLQDGSIEFEEFIRALSVTSRGNLDEKLHCECIFPASSLEPSPYTPTYTYLTSYTHTYTAATFFPLIGNPALAQASQ